MRCSTDRGFALVLVLLVVLVLFMLGEAVSVLTVAHARTAARMGDQMRAHQAAEAGVVEARMMAEADWAGFGVYTGETQLDPSTNAYYQITVGSLSNSSQREFYSAGYVKGTDGSIGAHTTIHMVLLRVQNNLFQYPVQSDTGQIYLQNSSTVNMPGGGVAVRTNSLANTNTGNKQNAAIRLDPGSSIIGGVDTPYNPASASVSNPSLVIPSTGIVTASPAPLQPVVLPPMSLPTFGGTPTNYTLSGGTATLSAGYYGTVVVSGGTLNLGGSSVIGTLQVNSTGCTLNMAPGTYSVTTLLMGSGASVTLAPGQYGTATSYANTNITFLPGNYIFQNYFTSYNSIMSSAPGGTVNLYFNGFQSGSGIFGSQVNASGTHAASDFVVYCTSNVTNFFMSNQSGNGGATFNMCVYAPTANVNGMKATVTGSLVGGAGVYFGNSSTITYDPSLASATPSYTVSVSMEEEQP